MEPHKKINMPRDKKDLDYPVELETQFILRMPEEPAKSLREVLRLGENFKNRLTIQMENDMRHGEVRFDDWLLHAKVVDLPTIVESLKTVDRKSVYKSADICQMMICKDEIDPASTEEESPAKNKKKDPFKVDKKFLFPHGLTPPTKNVRKRRFRKTLKKKSVEAPEIEKEVKRLLRADNEAVSITWEIIDEAVKEEEPSTKPEPSVSVKPEKVKTKKEHIKAEGAKQSSSKVEDIFGGTLSDSDLEDENVNVDIDDSRMSTYEDTYSETSMQAPDFSKKSFATEFSSDMFYYPQSGIVKTPEAGPSKGKKKQPKPSTSTADLYHISNYSHDADVDFKLQQLSLELEELKQRKQKTQQEISGLENMTLRQRFQEILQTINKDIAFKEIEYQRLMSYK